MKQALNAVAQLAEINIADATQVVRQHPLLEEEIHIEEELINLQEAFNTHEIASDTLRRYPSLRKHLIAEQRAILKHTIGLIERMLQQRRLPRQYSPQDVQFALRKLIRLIVAEANRVNKQIDDDTLQIFKPFLSWRQRLSYAVLPAAFSPLQPAFRRLGRA